MRTQCTIMIVGVVSIMTIGCTSKPDHTNVWQMSARGNIQTVETILSYHPQRINERDQVRQWTPLHHAIANSYGDMAVMLMKNGADPLMQTPDGYDAMSLAAQVRQPTMRDFIARAVHENLMGREAVTMVER